MTGLTHETVGVTTAVAVTAIFGTRLNILQNDILMPIALVTVATGSILPDIDLSTSKEGKKHKLIAKMFTHRGFTHTLAIPACLCGLVTIFPMYLEGAFCTLAASLTFGLLFGWVLHIFADLFNGKGVPLLWPLVHAKIHVAKVVTGKTSESIWLFLYEAALFYGMYRYGIALEQLIVVFVLATILTAILKGEIRSKSLSLFAGAGTAYIMYFVLT